MYYGFGIPTNNNISGHLGNTDIGGRFNNMSGRTYEQWHLIAATIILGVIPMNNNIALPIDKINLG
tara:strand:+ start:355 stop:552 length:198 start_codon:yes stop_codon:yes gene_type:complete